MRLSLCCVVFLVACQSDSVKGVKEHGDSKDPKDAATERDAAVDAAAPSDVEEHKPSKVDWILDQGCEPSSATDPCERCKAEQCCITESRVGSADTVAYARCGNACVAEGKKSFADCWIDCAGPHPDGTARFAAAFGCTQVLCKSEDACAKSTPSYCDTCLREDCTQEYLTILGTREGFLWFQCNGGCADGDGVCYQRCMDNYPNLDEDLTRLTECQASRCPSCTTMF